MSASDWKFRAGLILAASLGQGCLDTMAITSSGIWTFPSWRGKLMAFEGGDLQI